MPKSRMMGAGNACSTLYKSDPSINTGGGSKKQGITSRVGLAAWNNRDIQTRSNGIGRFQLFYGNRLGGIGRNMFGNRAGGTYALPSPPQPPLSPQPPQPPTIFNTLYMSNEQTPESHALIITSTPNEKRIICESLDLSTVVILQYTLENTDIFETASFSITLTTNSGVPTFQYGTVRYINLTPSLLVIGPGSFSVFAQNGKGVDFIFIRSNALISNPYYNIYLPTRIAPNEFTSAYLKSIETTLSGYIYKYYPARNDIVYPGELEEPLTCSLSLDTGGIVISDPGGSGGDPGGGETPGGGAPAPSGGLEPPPG